MKTGPSALQLRVWRGVVSHGKGVQGHFRNRRWGSSWGFVWKGFAKSYAWVEDGGLFRKESVELELCHNFPKVLLRASFEVKFESV